MSLPQFFITGAPGAGTSALHAALATHPALFLPTVKEPRFFLSDGRAPSVDRGPGDLADAHEWTWTRDAYEALFEPAPAARAPWGGHAVLPLRPRRARARIRNAVPDAKLVAILRNPVDRAYSNWNRQWSATFETREFLDAVAAEEQRAVRGWGRAWRYLALGRYGEQLEALYRQFDREQVHIVRYRDLVEDPARTLAEVCRFLGVADDVVRRIPPVRVSIFATPPGPAAGRGGIGTRLWRRTAAPATRATVTPLFDQRPDLGVADRRELIAYFADDIRHLEELVGRSYWDWFSDEGPGTFSRRRRFARVRELT